MAKNEIERLRVRDKKNPETTYTLLGRTLPKKGLVEVRTAYGFRELVPAKNLELIPSDQPGATLKVRS
jgi:hypothetical protein